jgi:cytidylate kinase
LEREEVIMNANLFSGRSVEALSKAHLHWQTHGSEGKTGPSASSRHPFTVAITREAGAGGADIAREVAARLGWPVYDSELLQRIAEDMGLHSRLLESVDEKRSSWLQECVEAFTSAPGVHESAYVRRLVKTMLSLSAHGACVIVGRGAAQILPAATTLRVRLVGPKEARIAAMKQKLGVSEEEAHRRVETIDRDRLNFVKDHFHKDATDPRQYDLILNSSRFSTAECADVILEALRRLEAHAPTRKPEAATMAASG